MIAWSLSRNRARRCNTSIEALSDCRTALRPRRSLRLNRLLDTAVGLSCGPSYRAPGSALSRNTVGRVAFGGVGRFHSGATSVGTEIGADAGVHSSVSSTLPHPASRTNINSRRIARSTGSPFRYEGTYQSFQFPRNHKQRCMKMITLGHRRLFNDPRHTCYACRSFPTILWAEALVEICPYGARYFHRVGFICV